MSSFSLLFHTFATALLCFTVKSDTPNPGTVVVFGGNGFVGRRICEQAIARKYNVIAVSRSGCPEIWKSDTWAQKVEWRTGDALAMSDKLKAYIAERNPVAVFTMMGTLNVWKQATESAKQIYHYAGTSNINVCNLAASIKSVKKLVFVGADVDNVGVNLAKVNQSSALWTRFWIGQYGGKKDMEACVDQNFGSQNGITFRPGVIAGIARIELFGSVFEFNRVPGSSIPALRDVYRYILPGFISVDELAADALNFVEGHDAQKLTCETHSRRSIVNEENDMMKQIKQYLLSNADDAVLIAIAVIVIADVYLLRRCMFA